MVLIIEMNNRPIGGGWPVLRELSERREGGVAK
jgi:hypothetical protein